MPLNLSRNPSHQKMSRGVSKQATPSSYAVEAELTELTYPLVKHKHISSVG